MDNTELEFQEFRKIPRLSRQCVITEKLDGTNGQLLVTEDGKLFAGSRSRWILTPESDDIKDDNYGFARWALEHRDELIAGLGIGRHFGEWWGAGIQRKYGLKEKRFSLFNTHVWGKVGSPPACCSVVPVLYEGIFSTEKVEEWVLTLRVEGSRAVPGFMNPEGVVVYHVAAGTYFKKTLEKDEEPKSAWQK